MVVVDGRPHKNTSLNYVLNQGIMHDFKAALIKGFRSSEEDWLRKVVLDTHEKKERLSKSL